MVCLRMTVVLLAFGLTVVYGKPGFLPFIRPVTPGGLEHLIIRTHSNALNPYVVQPFHFLPKDLFIASPPLLLQSEQVPIEPSKENDEAIAVTASKEAKKVTTTTKDTIAKSEDATPSADDKVKSSESKKSTKNASEDEEKIPSVSSKTQQESIVNTFSYFQPTLSFFPVQPFVPFHKVQPPLRISPVLPLAHHHIQPTFLYPRHVYRSNFY